MKFDAMPSQDGKRHEYCIYCRAEAVTRAADQTKPFYCQACHRRAERVLILDPGIVWWVDQTGEYWHESAGVFVRSQAKKFLFFERTLFPIGGITVPAGH